MYTSVEQSKTLVKLGLDPQTADLWYATDLGGSYYPTFEFRPKKWSLDDIEKSLPCWSCDMLMVMLPDKIECEDESHYLQLDRKAVCYGSYHIEWSESGMMFDGVYKMLVWLLQNKFPIN